MSLEQRLNYQLNKYPGVKKIIKRVYQKVMYAISPKIKSEGNIVRVSPDDPNHEYFFGYYDKSPWDISDRYMLCMKAKNTWSDVSPKEKADILLIDTSVLDSDKNRVKKIAETSSWNVQQGCMLQWLGPDYSSRILFNDYRDGKYVSVIKEIESGIEKVIPAPVYTVTADGKTALTLDFSRLYNLRPGYGYFNVPEKTKCVGLPDATAVWKVNLESGEVQSLLTYKDFATFQPRPEMMKSGTIHKVNHLMISANGERCMVLYRWFVGQRKYTRLMTFNAADGSDMYVLSDDDMVSHCCWKNNSVILAFENKKDRGSGYYLMKDKTQKYYRCWPQLSNDGHPSYSPDGSLIVTDTYPDRTRVAEIKLMNGNSEKDRNVDVVARVFAPFRYDNDTRCDLHPRWNHAGDKICFDSVFEGHRGLYTVDYLSGSTHNKQSIKNDVGKPYLSIITPVYNSELYIDRFFDSMEEQKDKNFELVMIDDFSTDNSFRKINQRVISSNLKVRIISNERNCGAGESRNIGIRESTGEWVAFVDIDDYVTDDYVLLIRKAIRENNSDVIAFDYYQTKDNGTFSVPKETIRGLHGGKIAPKQALFNMMFGVCGKSIRKSIIEENNVCFPELKRFEDFVFIQKIIPKINNIYYLKKNLYYYVIHRGSLTQTNSDVSQMAYDAFCQVESDIKRFSYDISEILYVKEVLYVTARNAFFYNSDEEFEQKITELEKRYPEWRKNIYIKKLNNKQKVIVFLLMTRNYRIIRFLMKNI